MAEGGSWKAEVEEQKLGSWEAIRLGGWEDKKLGKWEEYGYSLFCYSLLVLGRQFEKDQSDRKWPSSLPASRPPSIV
jgi:hypothetical protein